MTSLHGCVLLGHEHTSRLVKQTFTCMQDDLQQLQMQLVHRQMAEPGMALSPALLFGDPNAWAADPQMLSLLRDIASGQGTGQM